MMANSAMPERIRRETLVNEMVRRLDNTSQNHPETRKNTRKGAASKRSTIPGTEIAPRRKYQPERRTNTTLKTGIILEKRSTPRKENALERGTSLGGTVPRKTETTPRKENLIEAQGKAPEETD